MLGSRMDGSVGEGLRNEVKAGNSLRSTGVRAGVRAVAEISQRVMSSQRQEEGRRLPSGGERRKKWGRLHRFPRKCWHGLRSVSQALPAPTVQGPSISAAGTFSSRSLHHRPEKMIVKSASGCVPLAAS